MEATLSRAHRRLQGLAAAFTVTALALLVGPRAVLANELFSAGAARGFVIHTPDEVLRDYCEQDADGVWLVLPGGARYELVTSTGDPAITNSGDGAFHPFDAVQVRDALGALAFPLTGIQADVFLLPYPRRSGLESAAGPGLILLSPGVRPLSTQQQHAEFVHELGHVVQYALLPDRDEAGWTAYRRLREIQDDALFSRSSAHAFRPHEIFAEDFRALFGGAIANASGTIENSTILHPNDVPGLGRLMLGLGGVSEAPRFSAYPNPARGALRFSRAASDPVWLDLFDAVGRRVAALEAGEGSREWTWNRRDQAGQVVAAGVLFARVRGAAGPALRVTLLP